MNATIDASDFMFAKRLFEIGRADCEGCGEELQASELTFDEGKLICAGCLHASFVRDLKEREEDEKAERMMENTRWR